MKVADKDKLYEEVVTLEKSIRKKNPKQAAGVQRRQAQSRAAQDVAHDQERQSLRLRGQTRAMRLRAQRRVSGNM